MKRFKTVDEFIENQPKWREALELLRNLMLTTELKETVKWGMPVYTLNSKNVVGFGAFKSYFGLWFYQGALLTDKKGKLLNAQEGKTKAMRQWRFESVDEIDERLVMQYVLEAIENQRKGLEIKPVKSKMLILPPELQTALKKNKDLETNFKQLTPSKRRDYAEYIENAKRPETKMKRLDKIIPMILEQKGLNDKYLK